MNVRHLTKGSMLLCWSERSQRDIAPPFTPTGCETSLASFAPQAYCGKRCALSPSVGYKRIAGLRNGIMRWWVQTRCISLLFLCFLWLIFVPQLRVIFE